MGEELKAFAAGEPLLGGAAASHLKNEDGSDSVSDREPDWTKVIAT